ncbi:MAG: hypothetical protein U0Z26_18340, partial [Anaerolineales bacterium]
CADKNSLTLNVTSETPEIVLQVGEPKDLLTPAFKIDEEELLVITHRESPLQNMNLEEVQALFAGQGDPSMQVWVYASDEDVQVLFEQAVMNGRSVSSLAKLAVSAQQMSDQLNADSHSVGILPRHWKAGSTRDIYSIGTYPVLAITRSIPQGAVQTLITCLQGN